ncbi:hypothetical protein SAMN05444722_1403 [Rhodovulum sp. ES.010]|uniref:hypothetical protein n=1 Tax=Rhodovulum sp. ES.010 TaxID=1882821 RepID=UPI000925B921|nr:hypothetical protein [Rhodovulum sp. ES.010]SIO31809.1 hypothetical protein SAMN05444722_1403 [Rhodovulum sp. ES.010]
MIGAGALDRVEAVSHLMLVIPALYSFAGVVRSNWHARQARRLRDALEAAPPPPDRLGAARARIVGHEERAQLFLGVHTLLPLWAMVMLGGGLALRLLLTLGTLAGVGPA